MTCYAPYHAKFHHTWSNNVPEKHYKKCFTPVSIWTPQGDLLCQVHQSGWWCVARPLHQAAKFHPLLKSPRRFRWGHDRQTNTKKQTVNNIIIITNGQSNLTQGRITAAHGWFSRILQVAPMCTPYIESQKWLPWQHPLEPRNRLSSSDSLTAKTHP